MCRWKFLITNLGTPFGGPNQWVQRWLASYDPSKPRVLTSLLPLPGINNTMQTCLCQLNLFSNFPQGERVPLSVSLSAIYLSVPLCSSFLHTVTPFVSYLSFHHIGTISATVASMICWVSRRSRQEPSGWHRCSNNAEKQGQQWSYR